MARLDMHQSQYENQPPGGQPPRWTPFTPYLPGAVVWYAGTVWRSEANHQSGPEMGGAPTANLQLWTPLSSTAAAYTPRPPYYPQQQAYYSQQPPPQSTSFGYPAPYAGSPFASSSNQYKPSPPLIPSSSGPPILSPQPLSMPAKPPPYNPVEAESDSSPESQSTVTASDDKRGTAGDTMDFFTDKAAQSLQFITIQKETREAKDEGELKNELDGRRVWKVGGVGMWGYSLDPQEEELKRRIWREWGQQHGRDEWLHGARTRTAMYNQQGRAVIPSLTWKLVERGAPLPLDALPIGHESDGMPLFSARAWWEGGLQLGKAGSHLVNHASISYGGCEHNLEVYEVLCGPPDPSLIKWMTYPHGENAGVEGWQPVEGGREKDGAPIFLAKGEYENGVHPGKCLLNDDHACVGWGGGELWVRPFQILAYCSPNRR